MRSWCRMECVVTPGLPAPGSELPRAVERHIHIRRSGSYLAGVHPEVQVRVPVGPALWNGTPGRIIAAATVASAAARIQVLAMNRHTITVMSPYRSRATYSAKASLLISLPTR